MTNQDTTSGCPACARNVFPSQTKLSEFKLLCDEHSNQLNGHLRGVIDTHQDTTSIDVGIEQLNKGGK